jgi:VWFA-related protein
MVVYVKRVTAYLIALVVISALALPAISHAQQPAQIVINYPEAVDTGDALQLGLYFTVTDNAGRVVPNAKVQSAKIQLDDGERDDNASVEQPTTPFYIALVLDASGSMGGSAEAMRQAAIQAVNDSPEEARFAVIRFNEKIDRLQDFTEDRNGVINAIGEVQPVNLSGTCLYDATYQAVELMRNAPPGRRAIIVFTDGKDEVLSGDPCSRHVLSEVVELANMADSRVPIHTIGLSTSAENINVSELRGIASQTGGLAAIGEQGDLPNLFQQIMDALKSQWLAQGLFFPMRGTHTATLTVTLDDGTVMTSVATFEVLRDFQVPITPSATPTPIIVDIDILSVTSDVPNELVELEVEVQGEQAIREYRFDFFDADTNSKITQHVLPAPLTPPITFSAAPFNGDVRVELRAIGTNGELLSWQGDRGNQSVDHAEYEFTYLRPTPTPIPPTFTVIPVTVDINSIGYDQATDVISVSLSFTGQERIREFEVYISDSQTGLNVGNPQYFEPTTSLELGSEGLQPETQYGVYVIARGPDGENLFRSKTQDFVYTPFLTPTPTPTETPSPTPTERPVQVGIGGINLDEDEETFRFTILTEDQDRIQSFELQLLNSETGLEVGKYRHTPPPYDEIQIPLTDVTPGEFTAILRAFGPGGVLVAEASPLNFAYSPPPTPTPVPTSTPSPTPTPTPAPGMMERATDAVRDNPALALVVGLIGFALVLVLIMLFRPRKKQQTGTDFLSAQTGFYDMSAGGTDAPPEEPEMFDAATNIVEMDPEKTDVIPGSLPPLATLQFVQYPDMRRVNDSEPITEFPFTIGRGRSVTNHLSLDEDTSVSRRHAVITFENGQFLLSDEGSSNGTVVDGNRILPNTPTPLVDGTRIMFGKNTVMTFSMTSTGFPGDDRTMPGDDEDEDRTDYINVRDSGR